MIRNWLITIRDWFTEHWGLKLVSLILAIGFWGYAINEEMVEVTRAVPLRVDIQGAGKKLSISKRSAESLYVRLRAPRGSLSLLSAGDVTASHKIENLDRAGEYSFRVLPTDIKLPSSGIAVTSILPEIVSVEIDEDIVKKLPVQANFVGEPAYGYKILTEKVEVDPNAVLVEGPKSRLEKIEFIQTEPIGLIGRTRSFRMIARLMLEPTFRVTSESVIDVFVPIREEFSELQFNDIIVKPLGLPDNGNVVVLDTPVISFTLKGPKSELDRLIKEGVLIYADVSGLKRGSYDIPATLILPETISVKGDPPIVKLHVDRIKS